MVSPVNGAILVMNATLNYFKDNEVNKIAVIASLSNLNKNAKNLLYQGEGNGEVKRENLNKEVIIY